MRHLLSLYDLSVEEFETILSIAKQTKDLLKHGKRPAWLSGGVIALLFEKPSLRTRVSFEAGMSHFGGNAVYLSHDTGWQSRESAADFVNVVAEYADFLVCRSKLHSTVEEMAKFDAVPVINGLTDWSHPCQALADMQTMHEACNGDVVGKQVTFVGDGNNVSRSLALACAMANMRFRLLGPGEYAMDEKTVKQIAERYPNADIAMTESADEAMKEADFVYTDVWTSMGQEAESEKRKADFAPFQLNSQLMAKAPSHCKILHCLPAKRGEEITDEVIDSANSSIIQQAGNRMHAQKGLLLWLALEHGKLQAASLKDQGIQL